MSCFSHGISSACSRANSAADDPTSGCADKPSGGDRRSDAEQLIAVAGESLRATLVRGSRQVCSIERTWALLQEHLSCGAASTLPVKGRRPAFLARCPKQNSC